MFECNEKQVLLGSSELVFIEKSDATNFTFYVPVRDCMLVIVKGKEGSIIYHKYRNDYSDILRDQINKRFVDKDISTEIYSSKDIYIAQDDNGPDNRDRLIRDLIHNNCIDLREERKKGTRIIDKNNNIISSKNTQGISYFKENNKKVHTNKKTTKDNLILILKALYSIEKDIKISFSNMHDDKNILKVDINKKEISVSSVLENHDLTEELSSPKLYFSEGDNFIDASKDIHNIYDSSDDESLYDKKEELKKNKILNKHELERSFKKK